tara:strand:+ start:595 stop:885 length:291 start_codon:yes stop_codon:yes gene_type:complete
MWNNRIFLKETERNGKKYKYYTMREVFYNEKMQPWATTIYDKFPCGETKLELFKCLVFMIKDVWKYRHDILKDSDFEEGGRFYNNRPDGKHTGQIK